MTRLERQDRWLKAVLLAILRMVCVVGVVWYGFMSAAWLGASLFTSSPRSIRFTDVAEFVLRVGARVVLWGTLALLSRWLVGRLVPSPNTLGVRAPRVEQVIRCAIRTFAVFLVLLVILNDALGNIDELALSFPASLARVFTSDKLITRPLMLVFPLVLWLCEGRLARWMVAGWPPASACPKCGYDLSGLSGPVCPECGADVREAKKKLGLGYP